MNQAIEQLTQLFNEFNGRKVGRGHFSLDVAPPQKDDNGNHLPGVVFRANDAGLTFDPDAPSMLEVSGSLQNYAISLTIKLPGNKYIHGVGTSVANLSETPGGTLDKPIAGSAVGAEVGDIGDWGYSCAPIPCFIYQGVRYCIRC